MCSSYSVPVHPGPGEHHGRAGGCSAAAMSSWVDSGLEAARNTRAPPARSALTRTAVSAVTCRQAAIRSPASGCSAANRSAMPRSTGMARSAQPIRASPVLASPGSAMSPRCELSSCSFTTPSREHGSQAGQYR